MFPPFFFKELEYKCLERGDETLDNWENKCSAFGRTKVRRKSPAAYQEAQIKKKNICRTFLRTNWTYRIFIFFHLRVPFKRAHFCSPAIEYYEKILCWIFSQIFDKTSVVPDDLWTGACSPPRYNTCFQKYSHWVELNHLSYIYNVYVCGFNQNKQYRTLHKWLKTNWDH